ncbi:MAG: bifunctional 4-hydroxy-2-oxoglutarate aldolase/2-dehydro-3-deoxy-phosphogluconate aldolase [Defluviitaleaceae bacterium]|nr:bifunctional 4-hydroxy-2-oxoglutarate aldolase/2-dehydro-3-deoxy-phosphogluconate aldolase [Defluviitaleaceae bacterium]
MSLLFSDNKVIKEKLKNEIVAVIRIKNTTLARAVTEEAIKAGLNFIELTLTIENAPSLIKELREKYPEKIIGAGTVLTKEQAEEVIKNGAMFIVCPCFVPEIIEVCNEKGILCLPGIGTATEAYNAYKLGCDIVKAFPGDVLGSKFIKNLKGPMPFINCMPSGGVSLENIKDWFKSGAYAVSIGSSLYEKVTMENLELINERAKAYLEAASNSV